MLQFQQLCDETLSWINEKDQTLSTEDCGRDLPSVQALQRKHMVSITDAKLQDVCGLAVQLNHATSLCNVLHGFKSHHIASYTIVLWTEISRKTSIDRSLIPARGSSLILVLKPWTPFVHPNVYTYTGSGEGVSSGRGTTPHTHWHGTTGGFRQPLRGQGRPWETEWDYRTLGESEGKGLTLCSYGLPSAHNATCLQGKAASRKVQLENAFLLQTFLANSKELVSHM